MEFAVPKPPSSTIVSNSAKPCRLRSIGVLSSEHHQMSSISCENASSHDDSQLPKLFDTVSALKLAYVQLQLAHLPYDPEKIVAADELVVSLLDDLCKFKEKKSAKDLLCAQIQVKERALENLKSQLEAKDTEAHHLQQQLKILLHNIKHKSLEIRSARILNIAGFQDALRAASKSIHDFAKPLICLMKASGWDLDKAANTIEDSVSYSKRSHKKYAFEAYIARRMFHGLPLESYNVGDIMMFEDPIDALIQNPNSAFAKFCRTKYLLVIHPDMEASFFGNLDQRIFVSCGKHPRTPFYQVFLKMAKWVWVLHGIGSSIEPKAESFVVNRASKFSHVYMESVEEDNGSVALPDEAQTRKVEFMVMPGFRIGETLVRSQVYLSST